MTPPLRRPTATARAPLHARGYFPDAALRSEQFRQNEHPAAHALRFAGVRQSLPFFEKPPSEQVPGASVGLR